jgi:large-conductance mechanosensitive channel|tara:strand:- start:1133 stop:1444 length:312 start_codon:yes stop_codon:yes gene_type:complete
MKKTSFTKWLFEKRDVDTLIIAFIISQSCSQFISDLSVSIINPIIEGLLPQTDDDQVQVLNIYNYIIIRFKLQYAISGFIKLLFNFFLAYIIVMYVYKILNLN